jgi:hypothetical protein
MGPGGTAPFAHPGFTGTATLADTAGELPQHGE